MSKIDFKDPFSAGQLAGMLVILTYLENNKAMAPEIFQGLKRISADGLSEYFDKPSEDIFLMMEEIVDNIIKDNNEDNPATVDVE